MNSVSPLSKQPELADFVSTTVLRTHHWTLDNGFIGTQAQYLEDKGGIFTGKVSLAGMVNPSLILHLLHRR